MQEKRGILNNLRVLPTAKSLLYHEGIKYNKEILQRISEHVLDNMPTLTKREAKSLSKKINLFEEILEALPDNKKGLLRQYETMMLNDTVRDIDMALEYAMKHENELSEVALGSRYE